MKHTVNLLIQKVDNEYLEKNYESVVSGLYPERREKIRQLKYKSSAYVSVTAGLMLQSVLKQELGLRAEDICLARGEKGKPYIDGAEHFFFNLSHSGECVVLAYSDTEVGVDVEQLRDIDIKVAKRCFCTEEYELVRTADNREESFYDIWTRKESYLKLTGQGISVPLNSFYVLDDMKHLNREKMCFHTERYEDYIISLCTYDGCDINLLRQQKN